MHGHWRENAWMWAYLVIFWLRQNMYLQICYANFRNRRFVPYKYVATRPYCVHVKHGELWAALLNSYGVVTYYDTALYVYPTLLLPTMIRRQSIHCTVNKEWHALYNAYYAAKPDRPKIPEFNIDQFLICT